MISLRESIATNEQLHQLRAAAMGCYLAALRSLAQYPVELEDSITTPFRKHVSALADELGAGPEQMEESKSTLRGLLRDYRDRGSQYLNGLRADLAAAGNALQQIMESLGQSEGEHDVRLRSQLVLLRDACNGSDPESLRATVRSAADSIEQSLEQVRKQHQVTVAQFHVELRVLHKRIDALEKAAAIDNLSRLLNRDELTERLTGAPAGSSLLLIRVSGIRLAETHYSDDVAAELTAAFTRRLRNTVPLNSAIGRWSHEEFIAILPVAKPEAVTLAKWIAEHLAGAYSCVQDGKSVRPALQLSVGVVEHERARMGQALALIGEFLRG